jgi:hypothetical protein
MPPYIDIPTLVYEQRFIFNLQVAKGIVTSLENSGFTLKDFLQGLAIICDERDQSQAAKNLERAAEILNQIKE